MRNLEKLLRSVTLNQIQHQFLSLILGQIPNQILNLILNPILVQ